MLIFRKGGIFISIILLISFWTIFFKCQVKSSLRKCILLNLLKQTILPFSCQYYDHQLDLSHLFPLQNFLVILEQKIYFPSLNLFCHILPLPSSNVSYQAFKFFSKVWKILFVMKIIFRIENIFKLTMFG